MLSDKKAMIFICALARQGGALKRSEGAGGSRGGPFINTFTFTIVHYKLDPLHT
jgi:hypothetical protein